MDIKEKAGKRVSYKELAISKNNIIDEERHIIRVKFASFGNKDSAGEILVKGCFAKSIKERGPESTTNRKIPFVWQHNMQDPIGKVLKIEEMDDGAYAEIRLSNFDAVPNAKRAWHQFQDGDINQASFMYGYVPDKTLYDEEQDALILKEVILWEISIVTMGCNEETEYMGEVKRFKEIYNRATDEQKEQIKRQILDTLNGAEPEKPLTPQKTSMFAKIGKSIN